MPGMSGLSYDLLLPDWKHLALPIVTSGGLLDGNSVYGLSFFIGMWVLIAYSSALRIKNFS